MKPNDYPVKINDRVRHIADACMGAVVPIGTNLPHPTTCLVIWGDTLGETDIQWTNKLVKVAR